jgi:hypothetical protein
VETKFKVGTRVKWIGPAKEDEPEYKGVILDITKDINYPIKVKWDNGVINHYTLGAPLELIVPDEGISLEEAEAPVQKEVIEKLKKKFGGMNENQLPPEPVHGQYYRTQRGKKVLYVGKGTERWIYQLDNGSLTQYDKPYMYNSTSCEHDIIAPWTEPLAPLEIKRWAVVVNVSRGGIARGFIYDTYNSKEEAREVVLHHYVGDTEIVELTGTLPAGDN